jgi:phage terminase large subunit GpA-like protein
MRRRFVPCPHCQGEQVLHWEQFRYETRKIWERVDADGVVERGGEGTEGAKARDTGELLDVWYECEHCRAKIEEHHKTWMPSAAAGSPSIPRSARGHAGFHLPAYYSPLGWFSWLQVVQDRLDADKDPSGHLLKLWTNTVAAVAYVNAAEQVSDLSLKERAEPYKLGTVPMGGLLAHGVGRRAGEPPGSEGQGLGPRRGVVARRLRGDLRRHRDHAALGGAG